MSTSHPDEDSGLRAGFEASLGPVQGTDLGAHLLRGVVLVVCPSVSLVECALGLARDDAPAVHAWLTSGVLRRASAEEVRDWPLAPTRQWNALVVRPFVLVQDPVGD